MTVQEIYYILINKLCLTAFILKLQESENSKAGQHICKECRHIKPKTNKQVDTYARGIDTLDRTLKDRLTRMKEVSTQS